jgi:hypothetical protein
LSAESQESFGLPIEGGEPGGILQRTKERVAKEIASYHRNQFIKPTDGPYKTEEGRRYMSLGLEDVKIKH